MNEYSLSDLFDAMNQKLDMAGLKLLCFFLRSDKRLVDLDTENMPSGKIEAVVTIIEFCEKRKALPELVTILQQRFQHVLPVTMTLITSGTTSSSSSDKQPILSQRQESKSIVPSGVSLTRVFMISPIDGWIVGEGGTILHYNAKRWEPVYSPTSANLFSVDMVSEAEGWAIGEEGTILHFSNGRWSWIDSPNEEALLSISMTSATSGWAVGSSGSVLHYIDREWIVEETRSNSFNTMTSVHMLSPDEGWMAASDGTLLHYTNNIWAEVNSPVKPSVSSATATEYNTSSSSNNSGNVNDYGGVQGAIYASRDYYSADGNMTIIQAAGPEKSLYIPKGKILSICMLSSSEGWAVGEAGLVMHYENGKWSLAARRTSVHLTGISMLSGSDGWAVGVVVKRGKPMGSVILRCKAGEWSRVDSPTREGLYSVAMVSTEEGWAVGANGVILNCAHGEWSEYKEELEP